MESSSATRNVENGEIMAEELNREGVAIPKLGRGVQYIPEIPMDGAPKVWAAVITEVVNAADMLVRLTAFPPGEPPRGIDAVVAWRPETDPEPHTWHWPGR